MAVPITPGTGASSVAAELVGGFNYQQIEVYGPGGSSVLSVNPDGSFKASIIGTPAVSFSGSPSISGAVTLVGASIPPGSVSGTVGASIVGQLPAGTAPIGSVATLQGTNPWVIVGSVYGSGSVLAFQAGAQSSSVVTFIAPKSSFVSGVTSVMNQTTPTSVLSAAGANIKNYVTHILCSNGAAVGTFVDIKDGGGNVLYSGYAAASGGGFSAYIYPPLVGSANKSVDAAPRAQASIIVAMTGYTDT